MSQTRLLYLLLLLAAACRNAPLEKPGVPIFASVRIDEKISYENLETNFRKLREYTVTGITVNLFFTEDSAYNFAQFERLRNVAALLQKHGFPYNLQMEFAPSFPDSLILRLTDRSLETVQKTNYLPIRICLKFSELPEKTLGELLQKIGKELPGKTICLFAKPHQFEELRTYDFDEFGYIYDYPPVQMTYKALARRLNPVLEEKIRNTNKALFIETYLTQQKTKEQLQNLLRFWSQDFPLKGVQIGTIYTKPALTDSTSRLGLYHDKELKTFLKEYARISRHTP